MTMSTAGKKNLKWPKGFLVCASLTNKILLVIDPTTGHIYSESKYVTNYWYCARSLFVKLDWNLSLLLMDHSIKCSASPDESHDHDPPPRPLVSLLFLRWQGIIHATWNPFMRTLDAAIRAVYVELMEDLPINKDQAFQYMRKSIASFQTHSNSTNRDSSLARWVKVCGPEALAAAVEYYEKTRAWPLAENVESLTDNVVEISSSSENSSQSSSDSSDDSESVDDSNEILILNRRGTPARRAARIAEQRNYTCLVQKRINRGLHPSQFVKTAESSQSRDSEGSISDGAEVTGSSVKKRLTRKISSEGFLSDDDSSEPIAPTRSESRKRSTSANGNGGKRQSIDLTVDQDETETEPLLQTVPVVAVQEPRDSQPPRVDVLVSGVTVDNDGQVSAESSTLHRAMMAIETGASLAEFDPALIKMLTLFRHCYNDVLTKIQT